MRFAVQGIHFLDHETRNDICKLVSSASHKVQKAEKILLDRCQAISGQGRIVQSSISGGGRAWWFYDNENTLQAVLYRNWSADRVIYQILVEGPLPNELQRMEGEKVLR